jgi:hypothetical protein
MSDGLQHRPQRPHPRLLGCQRVPKRCVGTDARFSGHGARKARRRSPTLNGSGFAARRPLLFSRRVAPRDRIGEIRLLRSTQRPRRPRSVSPNSDSAAAVARGGRRRRATRWRCIRRASILAPPSRPCFGDTEPCQNDRVVRHCNPAPSRRPSAEAIVRGMAEF